MLGLGLSMNSSATEASVSKGLPSYSSTKHISFNGVDQYGEISSSASFPSAVGTTGGTVSFWVKGATMWHATQTKYVIGSQGGSFPGPFEFFYIAFEKVSGANHIRVIRTNLHLTDSSQNKTWFDVRSTNALSLADNTWHHITFTTTPDQAQWTAALTVNGSSVSVQAVTTGDSINSVSQASSAAMTVGKYATVHGAYDVNELAIWNDDLTSSETDYIYSQGVTGMDFTQNAGDYTSSSDLHAWYKMGDETSGSTEPDSSGNSNDMTLYNSPTVETT